jgi:hypothetical protein
MKNTLQIIVLTAAVCFMSGCTSFYSNSPKAMKQSGAPLAKSAASAPPAHPAVIPDMPELEPVETTAAVPSASQTVSRSAPPQANVENPFANNGKLATLDELKPNALAAPEVSNEPAIKVVRLPKTDAVSAAPPEKTSEIQQVSYEEPELSPLPSSPEALKVTSTQTVPKDSWNGANNNVMPETQPLKSNELQPLKSNELTMTPTVLDVDKNPGTSPAGEKKDVSLPKSMNGSKPMESGVYLEELPGIEPDASQAPSQPNGGNSSQDIPDEIFDAPGTPSGTVNNAAPKNASAANVVIEPSQLEEALDSALPIQQCAAVAPIEEKFQIKSLTFVTSIRKLGDFTAVNQPYEFSPGQTLLLYMEFDNPSGIANLRSGFEVKDSQGKQIAVQDNSSSVPAEEKTFFQYVKLALPADVAPGEYTIRVWGQPEGEQNVSASTLTFKVK